MEYSFLQNLLGETYNEILDSSISELNKNEYFFELNNLFIESLKCHTGIGIKTNYLKAIEGYIELYKNNFKFTYRNKNNELMNISIKLLFTNNRYTDTKLSDILYNYNIKYIYTKFKNIMDNTKKIALIKLFHIYYYGDSFLKIDKNIKLFNDNIKLLINEGVINGNYNKLNLFLQNCPNKNLKNIVSEFLIYYK
jgi:hypothetical protein